jgi:hypothetical protein
MVAVAGLPGLTADGVEVLSLYGGFTVTPAIPLPAV